MRHDVKYESPANLLELLAAVVEAAGRTRFYGSRLTGAAGIRGMADFAATPITPIAELRRQELGDTLADPQALQWVVGRCGEREAVAVAEGATETAARYDVFRDALKTTWDLESVRMAAIVTEPGRRQYAAEVSSILGYMRIPAHVFVERRDGLVHERIRLLAPDLLVILADGFDGDAVPGLAERAVTFRLSHRLRGVRQLDFYVVDELGFLGHSSDLVHWTLYNDQYLYERSESGRLVVTALHNRTQPMLRIETEDRVESLGKYHMTARGLG